MKECGAKPSFPISQNQRCDVPDTTYSHLHRTSSIHVYVCARAATVAIKLALGLQLKKMVSGWGFRVLFSDTLGDLASSFCLSDTHTPTITHAQTHTHIILAVVFPSPQQIYQAIPADEIQLNFRGKAKSQKPTVSVWEKRKMQKRGRKILKLRELWKSNNICHVD